MTPVRPAVPTHHRSLSISLLLLAFVAGCGTSPVSKPEEPAVATKPAEPAVPDDVRSAADSTLGSEAQVLAFGDLAKTGKQQVLVANVVPKTPKDNITGTIVTRAVIAENDGGQWQEVFRCDEHLKNAKGYLGMTPIEPVSGWRLQFEQDAAKGLTLYLTPVKGMDDKHVLPIGVRWNPKTKRYQSLDRTYEQFLSESPSLSTARSNLR
jgi:hypothetical protein